MFKTAIRILSVLALMLGMVACSTTDPTADEEETGGGAQHTQPLRIIGIPQEAQIKGGETPVEQEFIKDYTLVFVNVSDTERPAVEAVQTTTLNKGVEYHVQSFPIEISDKGGIDQHRYRVFAFANFTEKMKGDVEFEIAADAISGKAISTFTLAELGAKLAEAKATDRDATIVLRHDYETNLLASTCNLSSLNGHDFTADDKQYVPMTGVTDYTATMEYHQPKDIPLVRMMAKLEFQITNFLPDAIRVKSITVHPVAKAPVYLFPHVLVREPGEDDKSLGAGEYPVDPGITHSDDPERPLKELRQFIPVLPSTFVVQTDTTRVKMTVKAEKASVPASTKDNRQAITVGSVYVNESLAAWHTENLHFGYDVEFEDAAGVTQHRYALSNDDFTSYCRNDHVIIPLVISSEYSIEPVIDFVAPIGGYPPVLEGKNDEEFYAIFSGLGEFAIYPEIYKDGKRTGIALTDKTKVQSVVVRVFSGITENDLEGDEITGKKDYVTLGNSIYEEVPHYSARDNAIIGALNGRIGHSVVMLTVELILKPAADGVPPQTIKVAKRLHLIYDPNYVAPTPPPAQSDTDDTPTSAPGQ